MRIIRIILTLLVLGSIVISMIGCSDAEETQEASTYTSTVQRGNLVTSISAAGNLALALTEDLAVDLFYQKATVAEVFVEEGDTVTEGQELVKLDADEWNDELATLEKSLVSANRALASRETALYQAERQVKTKEENVESAQRLVATKEFAVRQSELDVQSANYTLSQIQEIKKIQEVIDNAEFAVKFYQSVLTGEFSGSITVNDLGQVSQLKSLAQAAVVAAQEDMSALLSGAGVSANSNLALEIAQKQLQVEQKIRALDDARLAVENAKDSVEDAEYEITQAEQAVKDAQLDVEDALQMVREVQTNLDQAKSLSPVITAPFDGFVTKVNVAGGDEILKGTVVVQIADPERFEADILVSETDILQVEIGTTATVVADAISGTSFPATVTHISPTATISSGVVNYTVRVELTKLEDIASHLGTRNPFTSDNLSGGFSFNRSTSGNVTGGFPFGRSATGNVTGGFAFSGNRSFEFPTGGLGQLVGNTTVSQSDLREGMSVTVNLITSSESNVLLVPYTAVTTTGGKSYVTVQLENGSTEQREVTTGSTNYSFIAITAGLAEGDTIVVPEGTITSSGASQFRFGGGGMMIPGVIGGR